MKEYLQTVSEPPTVDLVVHVKHDLDTRRRTLVERALVSQQGVQRVNFNPQRSHLMLVGYDPLEIDSGAILELIGQHRLTAQLVGGL